MSETLSSYSLGQHFAFLTGVWEQNNEHVLPRDTLHRIVHLI